MYKQVRLFEEYNRLWECFKTTWNLLTGGGKICPTRVDNPVRHRTSLDEPIGLPNLGVTCWMNVALQLLSCLPTPMQDYSQILDVRKRNLGKACSKLISENEEFSIALYFRVYCEKSG